MRNILGVVALTLCISALVLFGPAQVAGRQGGPQEAPQAMPPPAQQAPAPPSPPPAPPNPVIVLDPAHGGTDSGARGQNGVVEKDLVLRMARGAKAELERQGFHAVMTRNDDSDPSYDDRAAQANAYHDAIFVSLHMASTGTVGSIRVYYDQFSTPYVPPTDQATVATPQKDAVPAASWLIPWNDAQRSFVNSSHRFADVLELELAQTFSGSSAIPASAAVRGLRSVAGPAVAVELSSVSAPDPAALADSAAIPLADAIARAVGAAHLAIGGSAKP